MMTGELVRRYPIVIFWTSKQPRGGVGMSILALYNIIVISVVGETLSLSLR
jgi:hypothetical protein